MTSDLGPISSDWTITELVAWLADDSRTHDPALRHPLGLIEAAVTGESWQGSPSTVALIRSLAASVTTHGAVRLRDLLAFRSWSEPPLSPRNGSDLDRSRTDRAQVA